MLKDGITYIAQIDGNPSSIIYDKSSNHLVITFNSLPPKKDILVDVPKNLLGVDNSNINDMRAQINGTPMEIVNGYASNLPNGVRKFINLPNTINGQAPYIIEFYVPSEITKAVEPQPPQHIDSQNASDHYTVLLIVVITLIGIVTPFVLTYYLHGVRKSQALTQRQELELGVTPPSQYQPTLRDRIKDFERDMKE